MTMLLLSAFMEVTKRDVVAHPGRVHLYHNGNAEFFILFLRRIHLARKVYTLTEYSNLECESFLFSKKKRKKLPHIYLSAIINIHFEGFSLNKEKYNASNERKVCILNY